MGGGGDGELSPAEARLAMMELANMISVPMALTAVIRLGVPAKLWAGGANAPLTAADLLPAGHPDPSVLERLLRLLASRGVFSEHTSSSPRRFSLTTVSRTLVPAGGGPSAASYADYVLQHHQDELVHAWPLLHEIVLDPAGSEPFARANAGALACEPVVPDTTDGSTRTRALLENDIFVMATYRTQGRERSEEEFRHLGLAAGFASFRAIYLDPFYAVLEYTK